MADPGNRKDDNSKDVWDKLSAVTPLIIGLAITGVGGFFTQVYNFHQLQLTKAENEQKLQLNKIEVLDKFRPLITSDKPEDREFGYDAFAALGYQEIAIKMIGVRKDPSGKKLLEQLQATGTPEVKASATQTLADLGSAQKIVNLAELGTSKPDLAFLKQHPEYGGPSPQNEAWTSTEGEKLGITSKLGLAVLYDTVFQSGTNQAQRIADQVSATIPPPLNTREKESAWLNAYLDKRDQYFQTHLPQFYPAQKQRTDRLRSFIQQGDWDLSTLK